MALAILPPVALGICVIVFWHYQVARRQILADIDKEIKSLAAGAAQTIDGLLRQRRHDLLTLAETPLIVHYYRNADFGLWQEARIYRQELRAYFETFSRRSRVYSRIAYLDAAGRRICAAGGGGSGKGLSFSKDVKDAAGRRKGILILDYDLSDAQRVLASIRVGKTGSARLLMDDRKAAASGEGLLAAAAPLKEKPWRVEVSAPLEDFLGPLKAIRNAEILAAGAGVVFLIGLLLPLVRSITRPVEALALAARRIGKGELSYRIASGGDDEIGALSGAFNEMAAGLESSRKQLIQAEKLSAVGQLISSVAHELNNPLQSVCGFVQFSLQGAPEGLKKDMERAYESALRCRKVVENLLFFVRKSRPEKASVDLNQAAAAALELLEYRMVKTEKVAVTRALAPEAGDVLGDFQQIVQVLVNLMSNACDAMASNKDAKKLVVRTWTQEGFARLSIKDNGSGIAPRDRERIFSAFFTTKERGTGLGLSICREIMESHGGSISFESGQAGTVFTLALPVLSEGALSDLDRIACAPELPAVPGKRVLVVDNESEIAELVSRVLAEDGDCAEVSAEGPDALRLLEKNDYDLVITDFSEDLYHALAAKGRTRLLFITGDLLNPKVTAFLEKTKAEYLSKPFDLYDLRQAVRRLLTSPAS